jgi:hypothetical protein
MAGSVSWGVTNLLYIFKAGPAGGRLRPPSSAGNNTTTAGEPAAPGDPGTSLATLRRSPHSEPSGHRVAHVTRSGTGAQKPETHMSASDSTSQQLESLREAYIYKVNAALERGREDLAAELADDYLDEAASALEAGSHPRG